MYRTPLPNGSVDFYNEEDLDCILEKISSRNGYCILTAANVNHPIIRQYFAESGGDITTLTGGSTPAFKLKLPEGAERLADYILEHNKIDLEANPHALDVKPATVAKPRFLV